MKEREEHTSPARHPLTEPTLFYDPPYERPLEDEFAWHLVKYLNPAQALAYQHKVATPCGNFWVDFVVEDGVHRVGFECGDLEEADFGGPAEPEESVQLRDALLLGSGALDVLYRFRGTDLFHRLHDCLLVAAAWDPELFSERGHINLKTLASPEAAAFRPGRSETIARLLYPAPPLEDEAEGEGFTWPEASPQELVVRRMSRDNPAAWLRDYDRALAHYGVSPEDLGGHWAKSA